MTETRLSQAVHALLSSPLFAAGWWCGLVTLAGGLAAAVAARHWRPRPDPVPIVGLLFCGAVVIAIAIAPDPPAGPPLHGWRWPLAMAAVVPGGWLLADFDRRWRSAGLGPVLLAVSVAGVYATVPDTEQALVALGAALPLALLGWPWPLGAVGRVGAYATAGTMAWVVSAGGAGRASSIVGGVVCLGLVAVEPLARRLHPAKRSLLDCLPDGRSGMLAAVAVHLGLVYLAARVIGLRPTLAQAGVLASAGLVAAVLVAFVVTVVCSSRRASSALRTP